MRKFTGFNLIHLRCTALSSAVALVALWAASTTRAEQAVAQHDRSNVRARPSKTAEVVAQLNKGDTVEVLERKSVTEKDKTEEWLRIALPATAKCYVNAKLIENGAAKVDAVNVRCGPGTHYRDVGKLARGERVEVLKTTGVWLEIKPTEHCSGWIAAELIKAEAGAPKPATAPAAAPGTPPPSTVPSANAPPEVVTPPVALPGTPAPAAPAVRIVNTDPDVQVAYVVKDGILRTVKDANAPAAYELVTPAMDRLDHRICYVEVAQMNVTRFDGKHVRISGNQHWRKGDRDAVLAAERVEMVW
jgi:uncharacterized protein YgiM (DUF1202 family)